jgi:hypothetical protein
VLVLLNIYFISICDKTGQVETRCARLVGASKFVKISVRLRRVLKSFCFIHDSSYNAIASIVSPVGIFTGFHCTLATVSPASIHSHHGSRASNDVHRLVRLGESLERHYAKVGIPVAKGALRTSYWCMVLMNRQIDSVQKLVESAWVLLTFVSSRLSMIAETAQYPHLTHLSHLSQIPTVLSLHFTGLSVLCVQCDSHAPVGNH